MRLNYSGQVEAEWSFSQFTPKSLTEKWGESAKQIWLSISSSITAPLTWEDKQNQNSLSNLSADKKISLLQRMYLFTDIRLVEMFILKNPFLINLLFEAYFKIKEIFNSDIQLKLEIDDEKLYLYISTTNDPNIAYMLLDKLDANWWFSSCSRAKSKMNIDLEF